MVWLWSLFILGILSYGGRADNGDGDQTPTISTISTTINDPTTPGSSDSTASTQEITPSTISTSTTEPTTPGSSVSTDTTEGTTTSTTISTPAATRDPPTTLQSETTTEDLVTKLDKVETAKLLEILHSCEGKYNGNTEYAGWISSVREASKWGKNKLKEKMEIRINFETYNAIRLDLEHKIEERIDELDLLIPDQERDSSCAKFYLNQKSRLKKALILTNIQKEEKLTQNSIECPHSNDYPDYYYYNDYPIDSIEYYHSDEYNDEYQ
ncbi:uncharacterized protein LOC111082907 [Drosophila obscura]|uniref:uncharacterized protein LOC111082907 n=1 Tax=Drosophila obscura TaxID=7282 RepID=UPI001BB1314C|nr:uncharacterized protein LOC111082907 [Drosophila obscura]